MAEPVYLASDPDVVVMLHDGATEPARDTALLICPPFGWQEQASYRSVRRWGDMLAAEGFTTGRLTLPGTGDSAGNPSDPELLDRWTKSVAQATAWLRARTGCRRLGVIGIGLGGILAWRAAAQGAPIDDFVLWAVPDTGRRLVHELRAQARLVAQQDAGPGVEVPDQPDNLIGFRMTEQTRDSLEALRLSMLMPPPDRDRRALLVSRGSLSVDERLRAHLQSSGVEVQLADGGEFDELMANPQQSQPPVRLSATVARWLSHAPAVAATDATAGRADGLAAGSRIAEREALHAEGGTVQESPLRLEGLRGEMYAVIARGTGRQSQPGAAEQTAIVFLGGGALPHTGPSRGWVEIARRWAPRGVPVVRVDQAGIGESGGDDADLLTDESFCAAWRATDTQRILDQLTRRGVASRFILGGLCSGANIALQTALLDDRVDGILLLNMFAFAWSQALVGERGRRLQLSQGLPGARARSLDLDLVRAAFNYVRPDRAWRLLTGAEERAEGKRARRTLGQLRDRGVATLLLLGDYEPMADQFRRRGIIDQFDRWPNVTLELIDSHDHMLRDLAVQEQMMGTIDRFVAGVVAAEAKLDGDDRSGRRLQHSGTLG
jgi:alpha-beta hydrolase superfamily lysophospholipase